MNKITKLILRLIKETNKYNFYINNEKFIRQINNIAIPWVDNYIHYKLHELYDLLDEKIDIINYRNYANFKNIVIYEIKDSEKLFKYFINNGIIWGGGNICTLDNIPKGFDPLAKGSYVKLYNGENRIYYGSGYSSEYFIESNVLTEDDFYIFYETYKKKINDNFERFLKK